MAGWLYPWCDSPSTFKVGVSCQSSFATANRHHFILPVWDKERQGIGAAAEYREEVSEASEGRYERMASFQKGGVTLGSGVWMVAEQLPTHRIRVLA